MSICVECVSHKRKWEVCSFIKLHCCEHPENMKEHYDYIEGKLERTLCSAHNRSGNCRHFVKKGSK